MDAHEELILKLGEVSAVCMGAIKDGKPEFVLVPLGEGLSEGDLYRLRLGNYGLAGVFSYANGYADATCEPDPDSWRVLVAATPAFFAYLAERLAPKGDAVSWLEKLHQLPDTREGLA